MQSRSLLWAVLAAVLGFLAVTGVVYFSVFSLGNPLALVQQTLRTVTPSQIQFLKSYYRQSYPSWLLNILFGNPGSSLYGGNLASNIASSEGATLELTLLGFLIGAVVGVPFGVLGTRRSGYPARVVALLLLAAPSSWIGAELLTTFSVRSHILPSSGMQSPYPPYWWGSLFGDQLSHLIPPLTTVALGSFAVFAVLAGFEARHFRSFPLRWAIRAVAMRTVGRWGPCSRYCSAWGSPWRRPSGGQGWGTGPSRR